MSAEITVPAIALDEAAQRLIDAEARCIPCDPVRGLIGAADIAAAYAVQARVIAHRLRTGRRVVGRKIGLTSEAVQKQLGVDRPDFGVLLDDMAYSNGGRVTLSELIAPRVEAEVAFVLREDLADGPLDAARVRDAVEYAVAALEIVDSRVADWDITFGDTVADNGSSARFVLGDVQVPLTEFEPVGVTMTMAIDGTEVSRGTGAACLGDPLIALQWLAETARSLGEPLRSGQIVLSGALGPMASISTACTASADIGALGTVTIDFA